MDPGNVLWTSFMAARAKVRKVTVLALPTEQDTARGRHLSKVRIADGGMQRWLDVRFLHATRDEAVAAARVALQRECDSHIAFWQRCAARPIEVAED